VSELLISTHQVDALRLTAIEAVCRLHNVKVRRLRVALEEISPALTGDIVSHG
jgi:hypothetical protein